MTQNPLMDLNAIKKIYGVAISARDFEINQLVQRNNFFMIFQGVLLAGLIQAAGNGKIIPMVSFLVCLAGILVSFFQVGMAAGAKFWQERWEDAVERAEKIILNELEQDPQRRKTYMLFSSDSKHSEDITEIVHERVTENSIVGWLVRQRFSPSRIPIYVAIWFLIIWCLLLAAQIEGFPPATAWLRGFGQL